VTKFFSYRAIPMSRLSTALYRLVAQAVASRLGALDCVASVYVRRSVACGEVVFGRSDIDVHILIHPFTDLQEEAQALLRLTDCLARLRRLFPILGDCDVSTRAELERWYQLRPFTWYRDRGWLKLHGAEFARPHVSLSDGDARDSLLWWFFWAWEQLPQFFRTEDVHTCRNLFLDMVNAALLYTGEFKEAKSRAEVWRHWRVAKTTPRARTARLPRRWPSSLETRRNFLRQLYRESLDLGRMLADHVEGTLAMEKNVPHLRCLSPFTFAEKNYLLLDPFQQDRVEDALTAMKHDATVFATTPAALALYWRHRNPWEYYTVLDATPPSSFPPPSGRALHHSLQASLTPEIPRRIGCTLGRKGRGSMAIGLQYAQHELYADHRIISRNAEELMSQYQLHYGAWPYSGTVLRTVYFQYDYPRLCRTIDSLARKIDSLPW